MRPLTVTVSTLIYSRILLWYPPALRAEFGDDMLDTFAENIEAAWRRASWLGVARSWHAVTRDLTDIVLPYRTARASPVLLAILLAAVIYGSLLMAIEPNRHFFK
jgi:hypothetical protein